MTIDKLTKKKELEKMNSRLFENYCKALDAFVYTYVGSFLRIAMEISEHYTEPENQNLMADFIYNFLLDMQTTKTYKFNENLPPTLEACGLDKEIALRIWYGLKREAAGLSETDETEMPEWNPAS